MSNNIWLARTGHHTGSASVVPTLGCSLGVPATGVSVSGTTAGLTFGATTGFPMGAEFGNVPMRDRVADVYVTDAAAKATGHRSWSPPIT